MGISQSKQRQRWKMTANEVMAAPRLIPGNEWSPLDGVPAPEYIPPQWDGPHVGVRLVDGFRTLANLPDRSGHARASSGFWPETWVEWTDLLAQTTTDDASKEIDAKIRNRAKTRPDAQEVSRMENVLMWPARFIAATNTPASIEMARIVQGVAFMRAKDYDPEKIARKLRLGERFVRRINREGLDIIAGKLRLTNEPVF